MNMGLSSVYEYFRVFYLDHIKERQCSVYVCDAISERNEVNESGELNQCYQSQNLDVSSDFFVPSGPILRD